MHAHLLYSYSLPSLMNKNWTLEEITQAVKIAELL